LPGWRHLLHVQCRFNAASELLAVYGYSVARILDKYPEIIKDLKRDASGFLFQDLNYFLGFFIQSFSFASCYGNEFFWVMSRILS
jgi:hypothetical protein